MYKALYRKYRPSNFGEVVGQGYITTVLKNEVTSNKIGHAYLFIGSRGTGKTTCARIFSRAINCISESDEKPCGTCNVCKLTNNESTQDIVELDAASNNGVNDIRNLCESSMFTPNVCKYKVYIVDEVHMLSTGAFNALLKTLEEPPSHVVFLLATTEVHKIPATILSRCQKFEFKKISVEDIKKRLLCVSKKENINLDSKAALVIAKYSDGALRDALSMLDKCAASNNTITKELVSKVLMVADAESIFRLCEYIISKDLKSLLLLTNELDLKSTSMSNVCSGLIELFRDLMLVKSSENLKELINKKEEDYEKLKHLAELISLKEILNILAVLQKAAEDVQHSLSAKLSLESAFVKLCENKNEVTKSNSEKLSLKTENALLEKIESLEKEIKNLKASNLINFENSGPLKTYADKNKPLAFKNYDENNLNLKNTEILSDSFGKELGFKNYSENDLEAKRKDLYKNATKMEVWQDVLNEVKGVSHTVYIAFKDSTAYISGPYVLIDSPKSLAFEILKKSVQREKIRDIIKKVTGKLYKLGPYKSLEKEPNTLSKAANSPQGEKDVAKEEMRAFAKRAVELGINVTIEDE